MINLRGKLAAALMTGAMAVAMMGTGAMAAATSATTVSQISKTLTAAADTYTPAATFSFEIANGDETELTVDENKTTVKAGLAGGLTTADISLASTLDKATGTANLTVNTTVLNKPGVYHYVVSEKANTNADTTNAGLITYDTTKYDVYVYIYSDGSTPTITATKQNSEDKVNELSFKNDFDESSDHDVTHDVTITKSITGNQSTSTDTFKFSYTVTTQDGRSVSAYVNGATTATEAVSGTTYEATLTNNGTIKITGLTKNDKVTIVETEANKDNYVTTVINTDGVTANGDNTGITNATITKDGSKATVQNKRDTQTPTGIVLNYAPYIMIAALAIVFAFMFLRRREREEI